MVHSLNLALFAILTVSPGLAEDASTDPRQAMREALFAQLGELGNAGAGSDMEPQMMKRVADSLAQMNTDAFKKPLCPTGQTAVTKQSLYHKIRATGKREYLLKKRTPQYEWGLCASHSHEACLMTCGTTFLKCAEMFETCMYDHCASSYKTDLEGCRAAVGTHTSALRIIGAMSHRRSQEHVCDCVSRDDAIVRQTEELNGFYATFAPSKKEKVNQLKGKYVGNTGFPYLMLSLRKKYPDSVDVHKMTEAEIQAQETQTSEVSKKWMKDMEKKADQEGNVHVPTYDGADDETSDGGTTSSRGKPQRSRGHQREL